MLSYPYCLSWSRMWDKMTFWDDYSSLSAFLEGIHIPNPLCHSGKAKRSHSRSFSGDRLAIAGIRFVLITSSRGTSRWLISGTTRLRYVHLLSRPWVRAEKAAWGCDVATSLTILMLDDHVHTLELTSHTLQHIFENQSLHQDMVCYQGWHHSWLSKCVGGFIKVSLLCHEPSLDGLGKYPKARTSAANLFHHACNCLTVPMATESSAYQICLHGPSSLLMSVHETEWHLHQVRA